MFDLNKHDARRAPKLHATGDVMYPGSGLRDRISASFFPAELLVTGLLMLETHAGSRLFPVFVDPMLEQPFSELEAFLSLEKNLAKKGCGTIAIDVTRALGLLLSPYAIPLV